jgi:hypothetical protein
MEKKINHGTLQYHIAIIWEPNSNRYTLQFRCAFRCHLGTPILQSNRVARYYGPNYLNISINSGINLHAVCASWTTGRVCCCAVTLRTLRESPPH